MPGMADHPAWWGVYLTVDDVDAATAFYTEVLGVGWEQMSIKGGPGYTCLMVGGRPVGGAMVLGEDMGEGIPPHWNVYFNVGSVDETIGRSTELGGTVVAPAFDVPGVGPMAVLADPQGAMFSLMQNPG